ncbi:nuclear transport factor 2 family protein [Pedobacter sp. L105]|uniref:nuclear transport factor 2 family protein n=1 Tax=Pedobacter sp. L105 TaxID=1641871 RepID=UPI00131A844E|nr:nuclear transport factor 2 family protein [Pedobacter sp. L105]
MKKPIEIVEDVRKALETRNYDDFVNCFAQDAVLEMPFALENTPSRFEGIEKIAERFGEKSQLHNINKLYKLHQVNAVIYQSTDPDTILLELSLKGTNNATSHSFNVASSVAVIRFKDGKIINYRDYPNTMGLAGAIGLLPQLAASLIKS